VSIFTVFHSSFLDIKIKINIKHLVIFTACILLLCLDIIKYRALYIISCFFWNPELKINIKWFRVFQVSSKRRAVFAVLADYEATVAHLKQIVETSKKGDERAKAKKLLSDMTRVKFVKYIHLMIDVLKCVSAASQVFQVKDLLMFEIKEVVDTL